MIERNLAERYRLEGRLGQGGMAVVYRGIDTVLRRRVAIKVLRESLATDTEFVSRFYTEAHHAAKLSHPNIVNVYDVGREGDAYYIVMELVEGTTLAAMIDDDRRLPESVAIDYALQMCSGLAYAHRQGLLHRDIKPANVLVTQDDVVKISDFGIARAVATQTITATQADVVLGSVYFLSPEQAQGRELRETSDLYSVGVVLYYLLSGTLPYTGETAVAIALKHVSAPVPMLDATALGIGQELCAIVYRLMMKDPAERYASANDVARALRDARESGSSMTAKRPGLTRTLPRFDRPRDDAAPPPERWLPPVEADARPGPATTDRRRALVPVVAVVLALAVVAGYLLSSGRGRLFGSASVRVPSVVGVDLAQAQRRLEAAGFHVAVTTQPSESLPAGRILRQTPDGAATIAAGSTITLVASGGYPEVTLIDVRRYSSEDARRYLQAAHLQERRKEVYDAAPPGTVIDQRPAPGTTIHERDSVELTISRGAQPVDVPDLVSLTVDDARKVATARHLELSIDREPSDSIPLDVVTSQHPEAGDRMDPHAPLTLVVSSGPPQVAVPDVTGRALADGTDALQQAGMPATIEYVVDGTATSGTILKQTPAGGVLARRGTPVTVAVAVTGLVPDVAGKAPAQAQAILRAAGYAVGNTAYVQEGTEGTVARTEPAAGSTLRPGETVMLYVSGTPTAPQ